MSTRIEWMSAGWTSVGFLLPGDEAEDGQEIDTGEGMAIQLLADEGVCITGEPGAIRSLAMRMIRATVLAEVEIAEQKKKKKEKKK